MKQIMLIILSLILNGCTLSKKSVAIIQKYIKVTYLECNLDQSSKLYSGLIFNKEVKREISRCNSLFHVKNQRKNLRISSIKLISKGLKNNPYYEVILVGEDTYFKKFVKKMVRVIQIKTNSNSLQIYEDLSLREYEKFKEMNPKLI